MSYSLKQAVNTVLPPSVLFASRVIGLAAISVVLPGYFKVGNKMIGRDNSKSQLIMNLKAGGAVVIIVLVYLVNPISLSA